MHRKKRITVLERQLLSETKLFFVVLFFGSALIATSFCYLNADPYPGNQTNADPDLDKDFKVTKS